MSFSCADCEQTFNNFAARSRHRWSQHSEIPPITVHGKEYGVKRKGDRLHCPVEQCGRSYASREAFMKHVKTAHAVVRESSRSSQAGSPQQDGRRQRLSSTERKAIEASGGEGCGEAPPPTAFSVASEGKVRVPLHPPEDVSMRQGHTTAVVVEKSVAGGSGSTQAGEQSPSGIPGVLAVNLQLFSEPPEAESLIHGSNAEARPVEGEESLVDKAPNNNRKARSY
ncbi:hypothetical protein EV363DRAFT_159992 [Boletus edulis]|nr:hypothetical protein EV363DRAFT_159992 [Boletus edulis]